MHALVPFDPVRVVAVTWRATSCFVLCHMYRLAVLWFQPYKFYMLHLSSRSRRQQKSHENIGLGSFNTVSHLNAACKSMGVGYEVAILIIG